MRTTPAERQHYEIRERWDLDEMRRTESARLKVVAGFVPEGVRSLLDAGGANGLFAEELQRARPDIGRVVCLDRSAAALKAGSGPRVQSSLEALPFSDGTFDAVTVLEVLEHLPAPVFSVALEELARVAGGWLLVAVPFRQDLERMLVTCPACLARFNPYFHVRSFDKRRLRTLFDRAGWECVRIGFEGSSETLVGSGPLVRLFSRRQTTQSPFRFPIPCPVCSESLPAAASPNPGTSCAGDRPSPLRRAVRRVWPRRVVPARAVALYRPVPAASGHPSGARA